METLIFLVHNLLREKINSHGFLQNSLKMSNKKLLLYFVFYLDQPDYLKLYPSVKLIQRKEGTELSVTCTTEFMSNSRKFSWFKHNNVLPNTTGIVRNSTFLRLNFPSLKEEDSGMYKCNITDDKNILDKSFQLIVLKTGV